MINYISGKSHANRYKDTYRFTLVKDNQYRFDMDGNSMQWMRVGGKEGEQDINADDLGMIDPSGGPFLSVHCFKIDGQEVTRIFCLGNDYFFEVKKD